MKKIETIVPYNQNVPLHIGAFIEAIEQLEMHFDAASMEHFSNQIRSWGWLLNGQWLFAGI